MSITRESNDSQTQSEHSPYWVRLPGFLADEEIGLGDVIKRASSYVGIRPCGSCQRRAASLNHWVVFTGRSK